MVFIKSGHEISFDLLTITTPVMESEIHGFTLNQINARYHSGDNNFFVQID